MTQPMRVATILFTGARLVRRLAPSFASVFFHMYGSVFIPDPAGCLLQVLVRGELLVLHVGHVVVSDQGRPRLVQSLQLVEEAPTVVCAYHDVDHLVQEGALKGPRIVRLTQPDHPLRVVDPPADAARD